MKEKKYVEKTYPVTGMHCAACAANVEKMLLRVDGVRSAAVNLAAATVRVAYAADITPETLRQQLAKAGFGLIVEEEDAAERQLRAERAYLRDVARRCVVAWACAVPVFLLSMVFAGAAPAWVVAVLSLPVVLWAAVPYYRGAWQMLKLRSSNMDTLVTVSVLVAFVFSLSGTLLPGFWLGHGLEPPCHYEAATMITAFVLTGKLLEERAKHRTGEAIRALMGLQPRTARVVLPDGREAYEMRGLWEMRRGALGGPFVSLAFPDPEHGRLLVAEGFIYSPKSKKRDLVRRMEAALRTLAPVR